MRAAGHADRPRTVAATFIAAALLTTTACAGGDTGGNGNGPTGDGSRAGTRPPRAGGTLTMLATGEANSLDPFGASYGGAPADNARMAALYDPLVYLDPESDTVKPHLAEALTTTDGTTWTLRLRRGVAFSDGTPFDADAVRTNWEMHARPDVRSQHRVAALGLTLRVVDPLTLGITLAAPNPTFDRTVAVDLTFVAAPSVLAKGPDVYRNQPIGAGPFTLARWTRGAEQIYRKNPAYWQKDQGLPHLDQVNVKVVGDIEQQYNTLSSGGADIVIGAEALLDRAKHGLHSRPVRANGGQAVQFNLTRAPFDDVRARRALALAIDPAEMARTLDLGVVPARGYFNTGSPFFDPGAAQPAHDRVEAQRLFDELAAQGRPTDFTFVVPKASVTDKIAQYLQSRLRAYRNVSMRIEPLDITAYITRVAVNRNYQATLYQDWVIDPEPRAWNAFVSTSPQNLIGWKNPDADRALAAGRAATDPAARKAAYTDLQRTLAADLPMWVYAESTQGPVFTDRVAGVELFNAGSVLMDRLGLAP
ncbi:ABC transporter substrate-binding protein [Embleya sp. NPDC020886]|uniref:ABC transporter substrate-binding protein n=1 Tax=Embleya sp. NPDC020886 TaxID=3363980 RepID=UPI00378D4BDA